MIIWEMYNYFLYEIFLYKRDFYITFTVKNMKTFRKLNNRFISYRPEGIDTDKG